MQGFSILFCHLLLVRCADQPEEFPPYETLWQGTPPPMGLHGGDVTPPFPLEYGCYLLRCFCYAGQMIYNLEGSLAYSVHTGGRCYAGIFLLPPVHHTAWVAWIFNVKMTSYVYVFAPNYVQAQRGTSATPWRSGYADTSSSCSF
jgi:hypothetical protein